MWVRARASADASKKKPDDRKRVRQAPKGKGRLKQVLANALFGRCFPANKHLSGFLDGGGLVFFFFRRQKSGSSWSILRFFFYETLVKKFNGVKIFITSGECREARLTALAMLRLSGERRITAVRRCLSEQFLQKNIETEGESFLENLRMHSEVNKPKAMFLACWVSVTVAKGELTWSRFFKCE